MIQANSESVGDDAAIISELDIRDTVLYTEVRAKETHGHTAQARASREAGENSSQRGPSRFLADSQSNRRVSEAPKVGAGRHGVIGTATPLTTTQGDLGYG